MPLDDRRSKHYSHIMVGDEWHVLDESWLSPLPAYESFDPTDDWWQWTETDEGLTRYFECRASEIRCVMTVDPAAVAT